MQRGYQYVRTLFFLLAVIVPTINLHGQVEKHWNSPGLADWSHAGNWSPFGIPNALDIARIGSIDAVENEHVNLNIDATVFGLEITDGMILHTNGNNLHVLSNTLVSGSDGVDFRSRLDVSGFGDGPENFQTHDLTIADGARVSLRYDGQINSNGLLNIQGSDSSLTGSGEVNLFSNSSVALRNDGTIATTGSALPITQFGDGLIDLDGFSGNGTLDLLDITHAATPRNMTVNGTQLADSFSGTIDIRGWSTLHMNLADGWTADANSEINAYGDYSLETANITGSELTFAGTLNVLSGTIAAAPGELIVGADTTILGTSNVFIAEDGRLEFNGDATIEGGSFEISDGGSLDFDNDTTIQGGTFSTHSSLGSDGSVSFNGATDWNGAVTVNGIVRQNGDAHVIGVTTINAGIFDMDGNGNTNWDIDSSLTINADGVDSTISNSFDGTLTIGTGISSSLAVNLSQPSDHWTMAGTLNISNGLPFQQTRISGSRMRMTGELNVNGSDVRVFADAEFANGSTTNFETADTSLVMRGLTRIEADAIFMGHGTLINGLGGDLTLEDGVSLNDIELINRGEFNIGDSPGIAGVAGFESTADGSWNIELGGYIGGDEFDVLLVDGESHLAGMINVDLIDLGTGQFDPEVGDSFQILSSLDGVFGTFANDPMSFANGRTYFWDVQYNSHDVQLQLSSVGVPEPSSMAIISAIGAVGLKFRRKRKVTSGSS